GVAERPRLDHRPAFGVVRSGDRFGLRRGSRLHRVPVHRPDRPRRLPAAPSQRRHVRARDDRGGNAERQAVDAEVDLAGRHSQEVASMMERRALIPPRADDPAFRALWDAHRRRMLDLAFRILLDFGDAEDAVQEAFTRLARIDISGIDDPEGWLVVVTTRLCLDKLRTRRRRPTDGLDVV